MAWTTGDSIIFAAKHAPKSAVVICGNDDYVQVNAFSAARVAANDTAGTFSAWVNIPDIAGTYTIFGNGDNNAVEYLDFQIVAGKLGGSCNVATVAQWTTATTAVVLTPHKWHHVALVHDGIRPYIYVDGVKQAVTDSVSTDLTAWFDATTAIDTGRIGASNKAGDASVTQDYKGAVSNVKYWAVALTDAQVADDYNGKAPATITGTTADLISWWLFDQDAIDSVTAHNGTIVSACYYDIQYTEATSILHWLYAVVVGDDISIGACGGITYVTVVRA